MSGSLKNMFVRAKVEQFTVATESAPADSSGLLLDDVYPISGRTAVNTNTYADIWKQYPVFSEPSYKQRTNNVKYSANPDDGHSIRAEMSNVLYNNISTPTNILNPLPRVGYPPTPTSVRVGYWWTTKNLLL